MRASTGAQRLTTAEPQAAHGMVAMPVPAPAPPTLTLMLLPRSQLPPNCTPLCRRHAGPQQAGPRTCGCKRGQDSSGCRC